MEQEEYQEIPYSRANKIAEISTQIYDNENYEKSKIRQSDLESQLDTVNEKLNDATLSTEQRNYLLEQQYNLQKYLYMPNMLIQQLIP